MKVLITGSAGGIGRACALLFLERGHEVIGFDIKRATIENPGYTHFEVDISRPSCLPDIDGIEILINNAGAQNSFDDIDVNLKGTIAVTEKYGIRKGIRSILMIASASATTGAEFPLYTASKGGIVSYMRNAAIRAAELGATCNSISPGGVATDLNDEVMNDPVLWKRIMDVTPLRKWASAQEIAEWVYFMTAVNRSCTGEDIIIDNGETRLNSCFVWPESR